MHTCIAYSACIILTLCFAAIIDSSGSSCVWGWKGGRLVRIDSSTKSIKPLCLEATPAERADKMAQPQGGNWNLEDIKEALMDDMRAMMQNELRQALAGLMPPPAPVVAIPPAAATPAVNPPVVDASPANHNNAGGQPLNAARNVPLIKMNFEDVDNYMVEKANKESLELVQDLESK